MNITEISTALASINNADAFKLFIKPGTTKSAGWPAIAGWRKNPETMPPWAVELLPGGALAQSSSPTPDAPPASCIAATASAGYGQSVGQSSPAIDPGFAEVNPAWSNLPDWGDAELIIGCPMLDHMHPKTQFALQFTLSRHHRKISCLPCVGNPIGRARNQLATYFLATKAKYLLMMDGDMLPYFGNPLVWQQWGGLPDHPMANMDFVARLVSHGKPLVGGHYVGRSKTGTCQFAEAYENPSVNRKYHAPVTDELLPCKWVASGLMLIHRSVFEAIIASQPELKPRYDGDVYRFFAMEDDEGEDMLFCKRARQAGIQPHVDIGCPAGHIGEYIFWPHNTSAVAPRVGSPMDAKDKTGIEAQIASQAPKPLPPAPVRVEPTPIVQANPMDLNPALRPTTNKPRPGAVKAFMQKMATQQQATMNVSPTLPQGMVPNMANAPKTHDFSQPTALLPV